MTEPQKSNSLWWDDYKAAKIQEFFGYRDTEKYHHERELLISGLQALHPDFTQQCSDVVASAIDQVAAGLTVNDLDRATKTNIGPAIERKFLERFCLPQLEATEKIDTRIAGVLIDIKTTIRDTWTIHVSCIGKWCLLFSEDTIRNTFNLGIVFITADMLNRPNGDSKGSISTSGKEHIIWIIRDEPLVRMESDIAKEVLCMKYEIVSLRNIVERLVDRLDSRMIQ